MPAPAQPERKIPAALFTENLAKIEEVYTKAQLEKIRNNCILLPGSVGTENFDERLGELQDVEVAFSTWGMPGLTSEQVQALPNLKAVFYAAGSVRNFAEPFLEQGVKIISAWQANAIPVAEFTLAQILLGNKGYFQNIESVRSNKTYAHALRGAGNYEVNVSLLGAGAIGRKLIELLDPFSISIQVFDPYLTEENAQALGVRKVGLEEAFETAQVVSNHLANVPETVGLLHGDLFRRMPVNSVFINTGRGATVKQVDLIDVLKERPDLFALLDVTDPEPPSADSELFQLNNCRVSSHIAGSINQEFGRMADFVLNDFDRWRKGEPLQYSVTLDMLKTMA